MYKKILYKIGQTQDGKVILSYLERLVQECADVRLITDRSPESLKGHEIACGIIEDKIIRLMNNIKTTTQNIHNDY
jgi:hypothetical protein